LLDIRSRLQSEHQAYKLFQLNVSDNSRCQIFTNSHKRSFEFDASPLRFYKSQVSGVNLCLSYKNPIQWYLRWNQV